MRKWQLFAMAITIGTGSVGCDTLVNSNLVDQVQETVEALAKPTEDAPDELSINDLNQELGITEETDEQITGASSSGNTSLSSKDVKSGWKFGTYMFTRTSSSDRKVNLDYRTVSNGPVYAHAWYYKSGWKPLGWQYNRSNHRSYQGSFDIPSGSLAVYVGFFSGKGGQVTANMSLGSSSSNSSSGSNTNSGSASSSDASKFNDAISRAGGKLGSRKSEITSASSINGKKQEFSNGMVILKSGASKAYAIYGDIYQKWLSTGNTSKYGAPVSDITRGRTINGKSSTYQLYDKQGDPSLHAWSGGVFHFNGGIRDEWNRNGNYDKLGHPTGDERDGSQTFEKGSITWSNGRANVFVGDGTTNSCLSYPVGDTPGIGDGGNRAWNNNQNPFMSANNKPYHLGTDWNRGRCGDCDLGQPVYSISNGTVLDVRNDGKGWGKAIYVLFNLNGKVYTAQYAHLEDQLVKKGDKVARLQKIGTVGRGYQYSATVFDYKGAAHLHLEVREGNNTTAGLGYGSKGAFGPQRQIDSTVLINKNFCK